MRNKRTLIAGHKGLVGKAVHRRLASEGYSNLLFADRETVDFTRREQLNDYFTEMKPEVVIIAAGKVGGIGANKAFPADFLYENLLIWGNIIDASAQFSVEKLIYLGSATVYPEHAEVPLKEEYLLSGPFEPNVEPYALAKLNAIKLCENYFRAYGKNFIPLTLANLYGTGDHFNTSTSHVIPSLLTKFHSAKVSDQQEVIVWGSGNATRDFLNVDDLSDAILFSLNNISASQIFDSGISHLNVGSGEETSIKQLVNQVVEITGYSGDVVFDSTKPDGAARKCLDISRINALGWSPGIKLSEGLKSTYEWYLNHERNLDV